MEDGAGPSRWSAGILFRAGGWTSVSTGVVLGGWGNRSPDGAGPSRWSAGILFRAGGWTSVSTGVVLGGWGKRGPDGAGPSRWSAGILFRAGGWTSVSTGIVLGGWGKRGPDGAGLSRTLIRTKALEPIPLIGDELVKRAGLDLPKRAGGKILSAMAEGKKQATWGGRFSEGPAELMLRIGESVSFDQRLAPFDVQGSKAQAAMLARVGIITNEERDAIQAGLDAILVKVEAGEFFWDPALEDVHMNIEQALTQEVPAAAKLHTARSRNDQVATDMRLWFKYACDEVDASLAAVITSLVDLADKTQQVIIPGYTHLQRAQPVSMAHHLLAYVEMFARDRTRIAAVKEQANVCPLGSGAIAGTTLPIDREFVAKELGFVDAQGNPQVTQNSMDAVSDRDSFIQFASACASIGVHLSRLSEDFILWSSAEFGFVKLPDAFTTGSSLMPQKKNPDAFELIRGKSARLTGNLQMLLTMVKGLPLTYNRDLQEDKPPVFDSFDQTLLILDCVAACLPGVEADAKRCAAAVADPALLATDVVDYLVKKAVPFREAHHVVGALVGLSEKLDTPLNELPYAEVTKIHAALGEDWVDAFDLEKALAARDKPGMPGPKQVAARIAHWRQA